MRALHNTMTKNKYGNKRTTIDGVTFASKKEANRYTVLKVLKKTGKVKEFDCQVPYKFASGIKYLLDFKVLWEDGRESYEDVKGVLTPVYKLKKKLMKHEFGIDIKEI